MRLEFELGHLFPGRMVGSAPSDREIELFSEFWDDSESDGRNLETISRWIEIAVRPEQGA